VELLEAATAAYREILGKVRALAPVPPLFDEVHAQHVVCWETLVHTHARVDAWMEACAAPHCAA
jgi:hypothetical protein